MRSLEWLYRVFINCPSFSINCKLQARKHGMPTALCSLLPEVQQIWSVWTVQVVFQLPQNDDLQADLKAQWWEQVRIHENQNKKFNGFLHCLIIHIKLPFWPGCFDPVMTSNASSFAIPVQSIASSIAFSSSSLLIPRKDAASVSSSCYIIAWAISALSHCSSASMHAWDKILSFGNGRSSLNSSALQTCDKCKSSICGRMRSSAGLQFLNVAKAPHQYRNLPFWFMESMLEGVSSMKSVWKRIPAKTGNDYVDRKL